MATREAELLNLIAVIRIYGLVGAVEGRGQGTGGRMAEGATDRARGL